MAERKQHVPQNHQCRYDEDTDQYQFSDRVSGYTLFSADQEIEQSSQRRKCAEDKSPDDLDGELPESVPYDICQSIKPEDRGQCHYSNKSHEQQESQQIHGLLPLLINCILKHTARLKGQHFSGLDGNGFTGLWVATTAGVFLL